MPQARRLLGGLACLLLALLPAVGRGAGALVELSAESGLSVQSYHSDASDAETLARSLLARLSLRRDEGWWGRASLRHEASLTLEDTGGSLGLGYLGERWDLDLTSSLSRSGEGVLTSPLLLFDPDSLASRVADSQDYWRRNAGLRLGWRDLNWDLGLSAELSDLDYDEASDLLADRRELRLESRLGRVLGAEGAGRLALGLVSRALDYRGRDGSDRHELSGSLRLGRDLDTGELALIAEAERHRPRDPDAVAYYERPDGSTWTLGGEALLLNDRGDWSLRVEGGRENWAERETSYFNAGSLLRAELLGGLAFARHRGKPRRLELVLSAERFDPDELPTDDELRRPWELRLESSLRLSRDPAERLSLALGLRAESLHQEADSADEFLVLEASLEPGWRPVPAWLVALVLRGDNYRSHYGTSSSDGGDSEWGVSADFTLRHARPRWEAELFFARRDYYSFLLEDEASHDAELGLRIRWHP